MLQAKLLVEDLITAQQALGSGDSIPGRANFQRLKTDGFDGEGQPLFLDLDQLYELLTESAEAQP